MPCAVITVADLADFHEELWNARDTCAVIVCFDAEWSWACRQVGRFVRCLARQHRDSDLVFLRVDDVASPTVAAALKVDRWPTFRVYVNGSVALEYAGTSEKRLKQIADKYKYWASPGVFENKFMLGRAIEGIRSAKISPRLRRQIMYYYSPQFDRCIRRFGLVTFWETQKERRISYIYHGYRPTMSAPYCLASLLLPCNNEMVNIWTLLISFVVMVVRILGIALSLNNPFNAANAPFLIQSFGACQVLLVAATVRTFNCVGGIPCAYDISCFVEYGAIALCAACSIVAVKHYLCPFSCYGMPLEIHPLLYNSAVCGLMGFTHFLACQSRRPNVQRKEALAKRLWIYVITYVMHQLPCLFRLYELLINKSWWIAENDSYTCNLAGSIYIRYYSFHLVVMIIAVFVYVTHIPEKIFPGYFDLLGNSRNLFYLLTSAGLISNNILIKSAMDGIRSYSWSNVDIYLPIFFLIGGLGFNVFSFTAIALVRAVMGSMWGDDDDDPHRSVLNNTKCSKSCRDGYCPDD